MEVPEFTIRRLDGEADARLYREIRLESLRRSPEAYGSDFDSENARPLEFFAGRLADFVRPRWLSRRDPGRRGGLRHRARA